MIEAGVKSNNELTISKIFCFATFSVLNVSTEIETGFASPIAYDNWTSTLSAIPAAHRFLATYLAA